MATYVFGIGGTGSRVMRALTNFLIGNDDLGVVHPILIDIDTNSDSLTKCQTEITNYRAFRNNNGSDLICHTELTEYKYFDLLNDQNITFGEYIGANAHNGNGPIIAGINKDFTNSLFAEDELNLNIVNGFVGHPNIGSFVFDELDNQVEFRNLLAQIGADQENNKIVIVNSLFGGTGASGLPHIVRMIEDLSDQHENLKNIPIAAVSFFPYYLLSHTGVNDTINANAWLSKSKAAAYYYHFETNQRINCVYPIYDIPLNQFEYAVGGERQRNKPHWVEMIGAFAIKDFILTPNNGNSEIQTKYFLTDQNLIQNQILTTESLTPNNFLQEQLESFIAPLQKTGLLHKFCDLSISQGRNYAYSIEVNNRFNGERSTLKNYLDQFISYMADIQTNNRSLKLLNFDAESFYSYLLRSNTPNNYDDLNNRIVTASSFNNFLTNILNTYNL